MNGSDIDFDAPPGSMPAYLSLPEGGSGPGLVVVQEWWGLVDQIRDVADRFAAAGFVTLAPDLYRGQRTTSPDEARKLLMALDSKRAAIEIAAAAKYLLAMPAVNPKRAGVVGFCMGGQLALLTALNHPDVVSACVDFYGVHPKVEYDPHALAVPLQLHFGRRDDAFTNGYVQEVVQRFSDAEKFVDTYYYDAGHAFMNDGRPTAYDADSAALAWDRTLAFLRDNLR